MNQKIIPQSILSSYKGLALLSCFGAAFVGSQCESFSQQVEPRDHWWNSQTQAVHHARQQRAKPGSAKNIILFVGDGMGISTVTAARILEGQQKGKLGEENELGFEALPYLALSKTYSVNQQTSDSAPTMTAMVTGIKTEEGILAIDQSVVRGDHTSVNSSNKLTTILHVAKQRGKSAGVVSTARITHATPAACYSHSPDRDWEDDKDIFDRNTNAFNAKFPDIARQAIEFHVNNPGLGGLNVVLGGGRSKFLPNNVDDPEDAGRKGTRLDGRNLTAEWLTNYNNAAYVWNKEQFDSVDPSKTDHLLGLFERSHMEYEADRAKDTGKEPSLTEMTLKAMQILGKNPNGYFLMVEAGRIDHGHHAGNAYRALTDTIELSNAVKAAMENTSADDTLIIVTADHSHVFTIAGYPARGNPIMGLVREVTENGSISETNAVDMLGKPYTTLNYANGPGYTGLSFSTNAQGIINLTNAPGSKFFSHIPAYYEGITNGRPDLTETIVTNINYLQEAIVPLASETHAGEDVAIFAGGPCAHLFRGVKEQNYIFHVMLEAWKPVMRAEGGPNNLTIHVDGMEDNTYVLQRSTDLKSWSSVSTNMGAFQVLEYPSGSPQLYFRSLVQ